MLGEYPIVDMVHRAKKCRNRASVTNTLTSLDEKMARVEINIEMLFPRY